MILEPRNSQSVAGATLHMLTAHALDSFASLRAALLRGYHRCCQDEDYLLDMERYVQGMEDVVHQTSRVN